jgi:tRNA threonylcarbamoyladenosine biosynthesis protein TsaE
LNFVFIRITILKFMQLICQSLAELPQVAQKIVNFAKEAPQQTFKIWRFEGEMGAGKTTLIKAIGEIMGIEDTIQSPTYSIVNEYQSKQEGIIYHFDFYRLKDESEAMDFGIEEYLDSGNYCWLEWASQIPNLLPQQYLIIQIIPTDNQRIIQLSRHE